MTKGSKENEGHTFVGDMHSPLCTACLYRNTSEEKVKNLIREKLDDPALLRKAAIEGAKDQDAMIPTVEEATKGLREAGYKVDHLAVSLASEEKVLPKEWSGFERLEKESALTFEEPAPLVGDWESQFDELFLQTMYQDDGYSEERAVLKDFIRSQIKISTLLGQEIGEEFGYNKGLLASEKESFKAGKAEVVRELKETFSTDPFFEDCIQEINSILDSLVDRTEI